MHLAGRTCLNALFVVRKGNNLKLWSHSSDSRVGPPSRTAQCESRGHHGAAWSHPSLFSPSLATARLLRQVGWKLLDCGAGPAYGLWNTLRSNVEDVYDHFVMARFQRSVMPLLLR